MIGRAVFIWGVGGLLAVLFLIGRRFPALTREDGPVESATAVIFFVAAVLAGWKALRAGAGWTYLDRLVMAAIAAFALLLSLSEVSFGARIFGLEMPPMEGGGEFDGGHDVVIWAMRKITAWPWLAQAALAGGGVVALMAMIAWAWHRRAWLRQFLNHPMRLRLTVTAVLLTAAVVLDLFSGFRVGILEEVVELVASVTLLMAVTSVMYRPESFTARVGVQSTA
jgi:hypothetical protein